jgi:hypothetical protein
MERPGGPNPVGAAYEGLETGQDPRASSPLGARGVSRSLKRWRIVSPVFRPAPVREWIVLRLPVAVHDFQLAKDNASNLFFRKAPSRLSHRSRPFTKYGDTVCRLYKRANKPASSDENQAENTLFPMIDVLQSLSPGPCKRTSFYRARPPAQRSHASTSDRCDP